MKGLIFVLFNLNKESNYPIKSVLRISESSGDEQNSSLLLRLLLGIHVEANGDSCNGGTKIRKSESCAVVRVRFCIKMFVCLIITITGSCGRC